MSPGAPSSREPARQKRGWRGGKHEAGSAGAAKTEAGTRAGPPRWPRQRLGGSAGPTGSASSPTGATRMRAGRSESRRQWSLKQREASLWRLKTPQPRARPPPAPPELPASRPAPTRGAPPRLVHTHRARAALARTPATSERSPPRPSPRSRHARAPSACPQRRGGR